MSAAQYVLQSKLVGIQPAQQTQSGENNNKTDMVYTVKVRRESWREYSEL